LMDGLRFTENTIQKIHRLEVNGFNIIKGMLLPFQNECHFSDKKLFFIYNATLTIPFQLYPSINILYTILKALILLCTSTYIIVETASTADKDNLVK
jgi:hypothetical protein